MVRTFSPHSFFHQHVNQFQKLGPLGGTVLRLPLIFTGLICPLFLRGILSSLCVCGGEVFGGVTKEYSMTCTNSMKFKFEYPRAYSHTIHLQPVSGCFHVTRAELKSCDRHHVWCSRDFALQLTGHSINRRDTGVTQRCPEGHVSYCNIRFHFIITLQSQHVKSGEGKLDFTCVLLWPSGM